MHIVAFFCIMVGLLGGFYQLSEPPEGALDVVPAQGGPARIHTSVIPASQIQQEGVVKQNFDYSCGSAALATLLNYHIGEEFSERQVIAGLLRYGDKEAIARRRAFSLLDMKKFVEVLGYTGTGYKATLADLQTLAAPCILPVTVFDYRHFVVFKGITRGHVFVADPWWGNVSYPLAEFAANWYGNAIFMVSQRNGGATLSALRLTDADMRFIDEDAARDSLFPRFGDWLQAPEWEMDKTFPGNAHQSKRFDGFRAVQIPDPPPQAP